MNAQNFRSLQEAYMDVYAPQELDEVGQTPKATAAYGALANRRRNTPASEYPKRGAKKIAVDSAERHMSRSENPDAGNRGKKSTKPDWNSGKRKGMTQSDRDHARGEAEYGHTGYDPDFDGPPSSQGSLPKGKKLERQRKTGVSAESFNIDERALDSTETKEKERIFKAIKPSKLAKSYPEKSPKEIKSLRYAISTKSAKRNMDTSVSDRRYGVEEAMMPDSEVEDQNKNNVTSIADKQKLANLKTMEQKQRQLRLQRFNLQKQGKLPLDTN